MAWKSHDMHSNTMSASLDWTTIIQHSVSLIIDMHENKHDS